MLRICQGCHRHVHVDEESCPFCDDPLATAGAPGRAALMTLAVCVGLGFSCGPKTGDTTASGTETGTTDDTTAGPDTETTTDPTTDPTDTGTASTTTVGTTPTTEDSYDSYDAVSFYAGPDPYTYSEVDSYGGDLPVPPCDTFIFDCAPDEKCVPYDDSGDGTYDDTKCVPIVEDPFGPGEPCTSAGKQSGEDDCAIGLVCGLIDPDTGMGVCLSLCVGEPNAPVCPDDTTCVSKDGGVYNVCHPDCDPALQDCADNIGCYPADADAFTCDAPTSDPGGGAGEPCALHNDCQPGLSCLEGNVCSAFCDVNDPGCPPEFTCTGWPFSGDPPPEGLEHVGFCAAN
ncbi:MAG: hypothetical protein KC636_21330 [Myxococcales bacterium]|nr:hypothetical protein [Myxococcales bacterium]